MKSSTILLACTAACLLFSLKASSRAQAASSLDSALPLHVPISLDSSQPTHDPLTHKDSTSGTLFYVESDGHHVSGIDKDGKLLWCTDLSDVTARFHLKRASRLLGSNGHFLEIAFGEMDSALIDVATGKVGTTIHD